MKKIRFLTLFILSTAAAFLLNSCKKNEAPNPALLPQLTSFIEQAGTTTAVSRTEITSSGSGAVAAIGVCWDTSPNPTNSGRHIIYGKGSGSATGTITGLSQGTTYYARSYATNPEGTAYGNEVVFKTIRPWSKTGSSSINFNGVITDWPSLIAYAHLTENSTDLYKSADNGASWNHISKIDDSGQLVYASGNEMYFAHSNLYRSTDGGGSWTTMFFGQNSSFVRCFVKHRSKLYIGTTTGVYTASEGSVNWTLKQSGIPSSQVINALYSNGQYLFALGGYTLYRFDESSQTWNALTGNFLKLYVSGSKLIAQSYNQQPVVSNDNGDTFSDLGAFASYQIPGMSFNETIICGFAFGSGYFFSKDGESPVFINEGLPQQSVDTYMGDTWILISDTFILLRDANSGDFYRYEL